MRDLHLRSERQKERRKWKRHRKGKRTPRCQPGSRIKARRVNVSENSRKDSAKLTEGKMISISTNRGFPLV